MDAETGRRIQLASGFLILAEKSYRPPSAR